MQTLSWDSVKSYHSPAKVNLFLKVLGKRADGFHELATLIQMVSLFDELRFLPSEKDELFLTDTTVPTDERNLVWKAVRVFQRRTGLKHPLRIHLKKNIPAQAGLGGGSGNAATTLFALNEQAGFIASEEELANWSQEIGSDVPSFFACGSAFCLGRGEKISSIDTLPAQSFWIVKPPFGMETTKVFNAYQPGPSSSQNDLESAAFQAEPRLSDLKNALLSQGFRVLMTGSGSSFLCFGPHRPNLQTAHFLTHVVTIDRKPGEWYKPLG